MRSTLAFTTATVYLQIWNGTTNAWETLSSDNKLSANTDVNLYGDVSDTSYYDFHNEVAVRVYQVATGTSATLSVDMVEFCFSSIYSAKYIDKDRSYQIKYPDKDRAYATKYSDKDRAYQTKYSDKDRTYATKYPTRSRVYRAKYDANCED